jgi:chromosome segregation ATPase
MIALKNSGFALKRIGILLLPAALILGGCNQDKIRTAEQQNAELQAQLTETETTINELMQTFNDVEANLAEIQTKEGIINMDAQNPELTANKRDKIMSDIQSINMLMDENRAKIEDLKKQLSKSGLKISNLNKKLDLLTTQLGEKEKDLDVLKQELTTRDFQIASLNSRVDTLNTTVATQTSQLDSQATQIAGLDKDLFTTYYTEGTYEELKEKGVIAKDGWTPWDGRKLELNEKLSKNDFTEIDKRETTSIPVNAKKASLVSAHPEGSYSFQKNQDGMIASLEIRNPDEFWKISDYLVLEVK